jgi:F-type H+-transporting ATPase subunit b
MLIASIGAAYSAIVAAVAPQAITVDVDATFLVQVALFVGLTLALKPLLFDPMLKLFEEREKRIDGAKAHARRIDEKSAGALTIYETEMSKARAAANAERDKIRAEGIAREQQILSGVKAAAARAVDEGKRAAHAEADKVRTKLRADAADMARELAGQVLGREVQP